MDSKVYGDLYDEFLEIRSTGSWPNDDPCNVQAICARVASWAETGNPFYMDLALEILIALDAPMTPTFKAELKRAIQARRDGTATGTWKQVKRDKMKNQAFLLMCNLRYHGAPIGEASEKAAVWLDSKSNGEFCLKASSIEKQYQAEFVKTGIEARHHDAWASFGIPVNSPGWTEVRSGLPGVSGARRHRLGERR